MRVHILAKELNVPSKTIIEKCQAEGITSVKNHMSTLSAGLHATILEWFSEGKHDVAVKTSNRIDLEKVRLKAPRKSDSDIDGEIGGSDVESEVATDVMPVEVEPHAPKTAPAIVETVPATKVQERLRRQRTSRVAGGAC